MPKRDRCSTMDNYSPTQVPDEGYSEHPLNLNPNGANHLRPSNSHPTSQSLLKNVTSPEGIRAWVAANTASLPVSVRAELVMALLQELPTSEVAAVVQQLKPRLYIDFMRLIPPEICLKILGFLDPVSLVSVLRTCRAWFDIALDSRIWQRLYHLEGWKAYLPLIKSYELKVNIGLNESIRHLHKIRNAEGHTNKIRPIEQDQSWAMEAEVDIDVSMTDFEDKFEGASQSIFGTPSTSFRSDSRGTTPSGEISSKGKGVDWSFTRPDGSNRRREPRSASEARLPPIIPPQDPRALPRSTLWTWDWASSKYRINWKYLYNMRHRLESNWELCRAVPFQLPHPAYPEEGHKECIYSIQFDNNYLVSGSRDKTLRIWDMHTRRLHRPPLCGHNGSVLCLQFDADPEEDILVSGSSDSNVVIWKFSTGKIIQELDYAHHESVLNVRFDKRVLVTSSKDKTVKIFNRRSLRYGDVGYPQGDNHVVNPVPINVKNYGYEPDLAQELPVIPPWTEIRRLDGHGAAVNAISLRGDTVVSVSGDRNIKVWNWPSQFCSLTIPAHSKGIACVEYDGRRIVSGSSDYDVCITDATTALKVAQLRGHSQLVRTVQAGFGDLPYSDYEDEAEARRVDSNYFAAVKAGLVPGNDEPRVERSSRRANAGSSNPEDVQAYGAKLPPGGGGGRKYGRIVSGSYDQKIIIWRRDKEGVWRPAHSLQQEKAAEEVHRMETLARETQLYDPGLVGSFTSPQITRSFAIQPSRSTGGQRRNAIGEISTLPIPNVHDSQPHLSSGVYTALMDQVVPAGPEALRQALRNYPGMLSFHDYLQATIARESSMMVKSQLRQVVADSLLAIQNAQFRSAISRAASPASSGSATPPTSVVPPPSLHVSPPTRMAAFPPQPMQPPQNIARPQIPGIREPQPARIFKLQFDARKIVCCSQASVIIGWDFCNGDVELEEAARFFAAID